MTLLPREWGESFPHCMSLTLTRVSLRHDTLLHKKAANDYGNNSLMTAKLPPKLQKLKG